MIRPIATYPVARLPHTRAAMEQNTDSTTDKPSAMQHLEIANFELSISNGLYWIAYEERQYPVTLTPYHLKRLFEIEGLPIAEFTGDEPARFSKAILLRRDVCFGGDLFDEEGDDITLQHCWVKEVSEAA